MRKLILIFGCLVLLSAAGLRAYFSFVPPPEATLHTPLSSIIPERIPGWKVRTHALGDSPEMSERISDRLRLDDAIFRSYRYGETLVGVYVAYWTPGKAPYRWAGAHTPDTCWVQNGWTRTGREFQIPFECSGLTFKTAEFGVYEKDGLSQNVHFWHLIGGEPFGYDQLGGHDLFGAIEDVRHHGLNLRQEQFFIRISSNKDLEELAKIPGFERIIKALGELGLEKEAVEEPSA